MKDMLAGAERGLTEIRARAVRLSRLPPSQSDPVRLARGRVGPDLIGPDLLTVERREPHFLGPGALCPLRERLRDQHLLAHAFSWGPRGWGLRPVPARASLPESERRPPRRAQPAPRTRRGGL